MTINKIICHDNIQWDEFPSPNGMKDKPGLHIAGTRLLKYIDEEGITEVVVPDNVTEISRECFKNCRHLKSIIIPDTVSLICAEALADCFLWRVSDFQ